MNNISQELIAAVEAHKNGDYEGASRNYLLVIDSDPRNPDAFHNLGLVQASQGFLDDAIKNFARAHDLNPQHYQFWESYIDCNILMGNYDAARTLLNEALSRFKKRPELVSREAQIDALSPDVDRLLTSFLKQKTKRKKTLPFDRSILQRLHTMLSDKQYQQASGLCGNLIRDKVQSQLVFNILGVALSAQERYETAVLSYRAALKLDPKYDEALYNLGNCYKKLKNFTAAVDAYHRAISLQPKVSHYHKNLITLLLQTGQYSQAAKAADKATSALGDLPEFLHQHGLIETIRENFELATARFQSLLHVSAFRASALNNLASIHILKGDTDGARPFLSELLAENPDFPDGLMNLAKIHAMDNNWKTAEELYLRVFELEPANGEACFFLGEIYEHKENTELANLFYRRALRRHISDPNIAFNLGQYFRSNKKYSECVEALQKFIGEVGEDPRIVAEYATSLFELKREEKALAVLHDALTRAPENPVLLNALSIVHLKANDLDTAKHIVDQAMVLAPEDSKILNNAGNVYAALGEKERAKSLLAKAIQHDHSFIPAYFNYFGLTKATEKDQHFDRMMELKDRHNVGTSGRSALNFTLGKVFQDLGEVENAFKHYEEANRLKHPLINYRLDADKNLFCELRKSFAHKVPTVDSEQLATTPIFILGMPRSGTTLLEQIISTDPSVYGAGEVNFVQNAYLESGWNLGPVSYQTLKRFRDSYRTKINDVAQGAKFVTDKTPPNFFYIGFILEALPEAKIIHTYRSAEATCWSSYIRNFSGLNVPFSYAFDDLVGFYNLYDTIMQFWHQRYPGRVIDISYEALTEKQEPLSRTLVNLLGLEWSDQFLEFNKNKRGVRTASVAQVREKMYRGSSDAWKTFETYIGDRFDGLNQYRSRADVNLK